MSEWKEYKLGDIADINMGQSPDSKYYNDIGIGLPFLQGNRTFGLKFPTFDTFCSEPKKIANEGEILFSVRAPVGDINIANTKICIGRGLSSLKAKNGNNNFLFYLLHFIKSTIINTESGTVFGSVNKNDLETIDVIVPNDSEQRAIASILSSLDDKIDLLHRQNKTLEQLAETLFRQWFVEEADESWEVGKLGDVIELVYGKGLKEEIRTGDGFPVVGSNGIVGYHSEFLVEGPGIVIGRKGTLGKVIYLFENFFPIDTTYFVKSKVNSVGLFYEYFLLMTLSFEEMNSDSAVPGLNRDIALSTEIKIAPDKKLKQYNEHCASLFQKLNQNTNQIRTLTQLRDTLLPKLMSGELRVKI